MDNQQDSARQGDPQEPDPQEQRSGEGSDSALARLKNQERAKAEHGGSGNHPQSS